MDSAFLITAFVTLLVVIDPIGLTPIFIALTSGADSRHRRTVA
ncbi:MarC family protein, partial [Puniceibacterium confluentis]